MKTAWILIVAVAVVCLAGSPLQADEKEKTLKGEIMCAKCALKETKKCVTCVRVKEGDKEVTYYFKDKGPKEGYHEAVCGGDRKEGKVTGVVAKKDGKNWITPKTVVYADKE